MTRSVVRRVEWEGEPVLAESPTPQTGSVDGASPGGPVWSDTPLVPRSGHAKVNRVRRATTRSLLALLGLVCGLAGCAAKAQTVGGVEIDDSVDRSLGQAALVRRSSAAVAVIETDVGRGMGFVIDPSGYLLTNRHVIEDADHIRRVSFPALAPPRAYDSVRIVYMDPVRDLALLRVDSSGDTLPHLPLASRAVVPVERYLHASDPVVLLQRKTGARDEHGLQERQGRISNLTVYNPAAGPGPFVGVTTDIEQGQSGGPVLDRYGRAVAVVTWTWREGTGGYAIPIAEATAMLAERPRLEHARQRQSRAATRSRGFLDALGRGDVEQARRFTSPSHARRVREETMSGILEGLGDGGAALMRGFFAAVESLAGPEQDPAQVLEELREIVKRTGAEEFRVAMGIDPAVEREQVVSFFFELGQAYLTARRFGGATRPEALDAARRRLRTVDAARTLALAEVLEELAGNEIEIESVELVPGAYAPRALVRLRLREGRQVGDLRQLGVQTDPGGRRVTLQMKLEWGDWYVADLVPSVRARDADVDRAAHADHP